VDFFSRGHPDVHAVKDKLNALFWQPVGGI